MKTAAGRLSGSTTIQAVTKRADGPGKPLACAFILMAGLCYGANAQMNESAAVTLPDLLVTPGGQGEVIRQLSEYIIGEIGISVELLELSHQELLGFALQPDWQPRAGLAAGPQQESKL